MRVRAAPWLAVVFTAGAALARPLPLRGVVEGYGANATLIVTTAAGEATAREVP